MYGSTLLALRGGGWVSNFQKKSFAKMYGATLLALRGDGWVSNFQKKSFTTIYEWTLLALRGGGWVSNFQKKALHNTWTAPNPPASDSSHLFLFVEFFLLLLVLWFLFLQLSHLNLQLRQLVRRRLSQDSNGTRFYIRLVRRRLSHDVLSIHLFNTFYTIWDINTKNFELSKNLYSKTTFFL